MTAPVSGKKMPDQKEDRFKPLPEIKPVFTGEYIPVVHAIHYVFGALLIACWLVFPLLVNSFWTILPLILSLKLGQADFNKLPPESIKNPTFLGQVESNCSLFAGNARI